MSVGWICFGCVYFVVWWALICFGLVWLLWLLFGLGWCMSVGVGWCLILGFGCLVGWGFVYLFVSWSSYAFGYYIVGFGLFVCLFRVGVLACLLVVVVVGWWLPVDWVWVSGWFAWVLTCGFGVCVVLEFGVILWFGVVLWFGGF